jgi:hypothetical protein
MFWNIVDVNGVKSLVLNGDPIPEGGVIVGQTADPDCLNPPKSRIMSRLEFRRLFTLPERMALDSAPDNQNLPAEARAAMKTLLTDLALAEEIDLDNADTVYGLNFIATVGLVTPERIAAILG